MKGYSHPWLSFEGFPSIGNANVWWTINSIDPNGRYTKDSKESLKRFLEHKDVTEHIPQMNHKVLSMILAVDIVYHRASDRRRYEWSGIAELLQDANTGEPFLHPIPLTDFYREMLKNVTAPNYRMRPPVE
ncbi:MAG: hypothetical protein NTNFB02_06960 [Nitrospira sp.]